MIIFNRHIKQETKKLKIILEQAETTQDVLNSLETFYERISNKPNSNYAQFYSLEKILKSKTIKELKKIITQQDGAILEVIKYITAPNKYLIIYNEFTNSQQTRLEIFKEKENIEK